MDEILHIIELANFTDDELDAMESAFCEEGLKHLIHEVRMEREMDKDNKKKKSTDFDKVLDSFCTERADLVRAAGAMHDMFESLVEGGFTEEQAMTFLVSIVMELLGGAR